MRIVIFTTRNHIYANKIIKKIFLIPNMQIVGVVESDVLYPGKNKLQAITHYLDKAGADYVFSQIIKAIIFQLGKKFHSIFSKKNAQNIFNSYERIAKIKDIPITIESNINRDGLINLFKEKNIDLFISVFFNQVFRKEILSIPRHGVINIHPALLPQYRGVSPTFWVLANSEEKTGVTIHMVNEKLDGGKILAQKKIKIRKEDTETSIYWKCVNEGILLLNNLMKTIGKKHVAGVQSSSTVSSYFSLPTKEAVKRFRKNGRRFFKIRELFYEK